MSHNPPTPSLTFTIPSIHDDSDLDCRIYNPPSTTLFPSAPEPPWIPRGAVITHPYAPLGGCYDDRIVLAIVEQCLINGLVVGTFNFRGASGSNSSTSWTSKPELEDYISFAGLMIRYLQVLSCLSSPLHKPSQPASDTYLTPVPSNTVPPAHPSVPPEQQPINLLLAGYSYGSLITTHLPATPLLQQRFASPQPGSAASEILARAQSLATETLKDAPRKTQHDTRLGRTQVCMVGGEESAPGTRRLSRDHSRKSIDAVRRSVEHTRRSIDRSRRGLLLRHKGSGSSAGANSEESRRRHSTQSIEQNPLPSSTAGLRDQGTGPPVRTSYLLVSPPLGMVAGLLTMSLSALLNMKPNSNSHPTNVDTANLVQNPTFVIYGNGDFFISAKRLRKWCASLKEQEAVVDFRSKEVEGAGHFWTEEGVEKILRESVGEWVEKVFVKGVSSSGRREGGVQKNGSGND